MRLLAVEGDGVALDTLGAQHDTERQLHAFEHRPLLDVQFQISRRVLLLALGFGKPVDFHATTPQRVFHPDSILVGAFAVSFDRMRPGECRGSQQTAAEARAFYEKLAKEDAFKMVTGPGLERLAKGTIPPPLAPTAADGAAEALFGIAASLNDEPNHDISVIYLRLALYLEPKLDLATVLLGNRFESVEKFEDAIATYRTIAADSPLSGFAALATAIDTARLGRTEEAIASLKLLTAQEPSNVTAWTALGDSYRQADDFPDAVKAYDRALDATTASGQQNWPLYYARAIAEQESGNWPAAEADLKEALKLSPQEPQVLNFLGYSWVDKKVNMKEALAMLEKARALSPEDGYIIDSVGWAYYRLGRYADAAKALEAAVELIPGDPTINDHLGDAYWRIGRRLDAHFQWSHALAFGAEADEKAKLQKKLQVGLDRNDKS